MKALLFLANGFEETEAIGTLDVLRRSGVEVRTVSISDERTVVGAHGVPVVADTVISEVAGEQCDALVLPGGMPGASNLADSAPLGEMIMRHHAQGKVIAAICAAPMVLGRRGLLEGRRATCYPGFEAELRGATCTGEGVTVSDHIITGRGPAYAFDFGMAIAAALVGGAAADEVAAGLLMGGR